MGYSRAGFEVVGVDIKHQKRYPFEFHQGDALRYVAEHWREFDAIHASPPCQAFTALRTMPNAKEHPDLVWPTRLLLIASGLPYVIENVPGAPLTPSVILCGTMFGLGVRDAELRRHRLFECNWEVGLTPQCQHGSRSATVSVFGSDGIAGFERKRRRTITVCGEHGAAGMSKKRQASVVQVQGHSGGSSARDGYYQFNVADRRAAMGIDWMTNAELAQAIPPAYTEFLGRRLLENVFGHEVRSA